MSKQTKQTDHPTGKPAHKGGSHAVKRHIRFDRVAVVAIPLLLILILITTLCMRSLQKSGKLHLNRRDDSSTVAVTTVPIQTDASTEPTTTAPPVATSTEPTTENQPEKQEEKEITLSSNAISKGHLILVNKEHEYRFPAGDPELKYIHEERNSSYSVSDLDVQLEAETLEHLNQMMMDYAEETGFDGMEVFSGYRTRADQNDRYENGTSDFKGGYSDYHTGRSFNLKIKFGDGTSDYYNAEKYPAYSWISEHAAEYGFVVRYPEGKDNLTGDDSRTYTFRYVGIPHAVYMTEHDLCLEEYLTELQNYTQDKPLTVETADGSYAVYYAALDGNSAHVTVSGDDYTVSGDNADGFVITVPLE